MKSHTILLGDDVTHILGVYIFPLRQLQSVNGVCHLMLLHVAVLSGVMSVL